VSGIKRVIVSPDLSAYTLPKALAALLHRFDEMRDYSAKAGRAPPVCVRLYREDWRAIDEKVRTQSNKAFNASTVTYRGLQLVPHNESPRPFSLEGEAA
jgi:hypothetical protein